MRSISCQVPHITGQKKAPQRPPLAQHGPCIIHEVRSRDGWAGLVEGFRRAAEELALSYERLSELAGLPARYANKLLAPVPVKNLGRTSFGPMLGALAVKIVFLADAEARAAIEGRLAPRKTTGRRRNACASMPARRKRKRRAHLAAEVAIAMNSRRYLMSTPAQRKRWARMAARARWRRKRES